VKCEPPRGLRAVTGVCDSNDAPWNAALQTSHVGIALLTAPLVHTNYLKHVQLPHSTQLISIGISAHHSQVAILNLSKTFCSFLPPHTPHNHSLLCSTSFTIMCEKKPHYVTPPLSRHPFAPTSFTLFPVLRHRPKTESNANKRYYPLLP
jgi:hypothetical protein